jgi:hypothetical protein
MVRRIWPIFGVEGAADMVRLKVTSKKQVTLNEFFLAHLGANPGDELDIQLIPGSRSAGEKPKGNIEDIFGMFRNETGKIVTIEDMNEAIAAGWAGEIEE